jgi:6-pyruvoyltetrahydropterin/6-carboxytetrahydropterin synthase
LKPKNQNLDPAPLLTGREGPRILRWDASRYRLREPKAQSAASFLVYEGDMIFLTRRATFSASHYYWNEAWSAEKNEQVFGRCANRNGHGHNYTLEVTVAGEPDPVTGFVVDLKWLKDVMEREVLSAYDHRHLNLETPEFKNANPTTENIAIAAWRRLEPTINFGGGASGVGAAAGDAKLTRVRVYETPEIFAEYRGGQ